ncbi:MAG: hypothetical protein O7I93_18790, partial [Gemmatimonadetes bacterium]|nr:hypothetical protein [Gemmatimonadota bacterium]
CNHTNQSTTMKPRYRNVMLAWALGALVATPAVAQEAILQARDTIPLTITVGARGRGPVAFTALDRLVIARVAGDYESVVLSANSTAEPPTLTVPVAVTWPPVARIDVTAAPGTL